MAPDPPDPIGSGDQETIKASWPKGWSIWPAHMTRRWVRSGLAGTLRPFRAA